MSLLTSAHITQNFLLCAGLVNKRTMSKLKTFGSLFLAMLSCFNIGLYASSTFKYHQPIDPHRWVMSSLFGLMFLGFFLIEYRKR